MNELMDKHLKLVMEANKTTNITRISSYEEGKLLHIEDSLVGLAEVEDAPAGRYVDLGSGAGFPGIPLAIATGRETYLVDSVRKKTDILAAFIQELGLENVTALHTRIEDLSRDRPCSFAVATARALSQLSVLLELASPLLIEHGRLVCYKARIPNEELSHALSIQDTVGMKMVSQREVDLQGYERRIICFEKIHAPKIKLPRQNGKAQKQPL